LLLSIVDGIEVDCVASKQRERFEEFADEQNGVRRIAWLLLTVGKVAVRYSNASSLHAGGVHAFHNTACPHSVLPIMSIPVLSDRLAKHQQNQLVPHEMDVGFQLCLATQRT